MDRDPITLFFPGEEDVNLYDVLRLERNATTDNIKKSYRRLALLYHPDKHATDDENAKADASIKFQQVGFAYAVLSDEERKGRYDRTGSTDEGCLVEENGWETYFEDLFDKVTRGRLDEMKSEYQGSAEELEDLKDAYAACGGDIEEIMNYIPHSTHDDESRLVKAINKLIKEKELQPSQTWEQSTLDVKGTKSRKVRGEAEAREAEEHAKELGVWEEFYGSGKPGTRKGKGKGKAGTAKDDQAGDHSTLQALILGKRKKADSFLDNLAEKYMDSPNKKRKGKVETPPVIDDAEFKRIQQQLMAEKGSSRKFGRRGK